MISNMNVSIKGKASLSSLVGIGSSRQVVGLDEVIIEVSSERSMDKKQSNRDWGLIDDSSTVVHDDL
ncbi:hypothetical protein EXN66_Car010008 [Channa argus]|uniref:Uncharacterized protein n=1 Tax=Channa argus TaxID=215402 RepID=A0A6G1PVP0_CHAAH|nr:hypothetical protein EXN66_Car010008 [Channa argus]